MTTLAQVRDILKSQLISTFGTNEAWDNKQILTAIGQVFHKRKATPANRKYLTQSLGSDLAEKVIAKYQGGLFG